MTQEEVSQYVRTSMERAKQQVTANVGSPANRFRSSQPNSPADSVRNLRMSGPPVPEVQSDDRLKLRPSRDHNKSPAMSPLGDGVLGAVGVCHDKLSKSSEDHIIMARGDGDLLTSESMLSTQSFTVVTEAEGTKLLSQEEIGKLVRNTMQRARQRKIATPRSSLRTPSSVQTSLEESMGRLPRHANVPSLEESMGRSPRYADVPLPAFSPQREEVHEIIFVEDEDEEAYPTDMQPDSTIRKFTWSYEAEESVAEKSSYDSIDPAREKGLTEHNAVVAGSSDSASEDAVNGDRRGSRHAPDEKEGPAHDKVPTIVGAEVFSFERTASMLDPAGTVVQSESTGIDNEEASSVTSITKEKQSGPKRPPSPQNSETGNNSEELTSEPKKEEMHIHAQDPIARAQENARNGIQELLDSSKTDAGVIEIKTESGLMRRMTEEEINNLFKYAMQKARESAQKEISELVLASERAARKSTREEIRDTAREAIRDTAREEIQDMLAGDAYSASLKAEISEVIKSRRDSTPRVIHRSKQTSDPHHEPSLLQEDTSSRRRHLSPRRQSPRRQKMLNDSSWQQRRLQRQETSPQDSTQSTATPQKSSHKSMEMEDSISQLPPDHPTEELATGPKVTSPSPRDTDPSTQMDRSGKEKKTEISGAEEARDDHEAHPRVFSFGEENEGGNYHIENVISNHGQLSPYDGYSIQVREEELGRPKAQGMTKKQEDNQTQLEDSKPLSVETALSQSEPVLLIAEGERVTSEENLTKAVKLLKNLEKQRTLFLPIMKTEADTPTANSKAEETKSLASSPTTRLPTVPVVQDKTNSPATMSAFTDCSSSEEVQVESPKSPPIEIVTPKSLTEPQVPASQWAKNLRITREHPSVVVEHAPLVPKDRGGTNEGEREPLVPKDHDSSSGDDNRLELLRRQRAQLSPRSKGKSHRKLDEARKLALMRKKLAVHPMTESEDDRPRNPRSVARSARSAARSRKGRATLTLKQKTSPKTSLNKSMTKVAKASPDRTMTELVKASPDKNKTEVVKTTESVKVPDNSRGLGEIIISDSDISRDDFSTERTRNSVDTVRVAARSSPQKSSNTIMSVSSMASSRASSVGASRDSDKETVVTEELINKIAKLKGSKVTAAELSELLDSVADKARKNTVAAKSPRTGSASRRMESSLCMDIFDLWPVQEEEEDDSLELESSWVDSVADDISIAVDTDTYRHYQQATSQEEETDLSLGPDVLSYSFSRGHPGSFTEMESGTERDGSVASEEENSFSRPGWWRTT